MPALQCPGCSRTLNVPDSLSGKKVRCPSCASVQVVPALTEKIVGEKETLPPAAEQATMPPEPRPRDDDATMPPPSPADNGVTLAHSLASAPAPRTDARAPRGYEILSELGRGGMGVVYKARQQKLNRVVALKMILSGAHAGEADLARFQTEAEAIARLQHPGIVAVYEIGEHEGNPFFALEFCAGGALDRKLAGTPMQPKVAADLVRKLAEAMHAAHEENVIHRDLKPANVLLAGDGTPKVTDFGLAKKLDEAGQTHTGSIMGTPSYMSPEQASGAKDVGPAADIYALGAILYECLTGRPPFRAATPLDTIKQVVGSEPVAPRQLNAKVDRDLETVCLKCLEKEPGRRYATSEALADDLGRFLAGKPVTARRISALGRGWRWFKRNPVVAGSLASAFLFLLGGVIGTGALYLRAEDQRRDAVSAREVAERESDRASREAERARKSAEEAEAQRKAAEAQRKTAEEQAARARQVSRMLTGMFDASDPLGLNGVAFGLNHRAGQSLTARELLERALELTDKDADLPPVARAEVYHSIGNVYRSIGLHRQAEPLLRKALALRKQHAASPIDVAASLHALGWLDHERGDYQQAERLYREALAIYEKGPGGNVTARLNTQFNLAWLLTEMGEMDRAEELFDSVLKERIKLQGDDQRETAITRGALASLYLKTGRPLAALPLVNKAIETMKKLGIDQNVLGAVTLFQQAVIQDQVFGNQDKAVELMRQAADLARKGLGPRHLYVTFPVTQLGVFLESQGKHAEALRQYGQALEIARERVGLAHPQVSFIAEQMAGIHRRTRQPEKAEALFEEVLVARRERYGKSHPYVADILVTRSSHEYELRDAARQEKTLREAEGIYRAAGGRPSPLYGRCLNLLGVNLYRQGKHTESEKYFRDALGAARVLHKKAHGEVAQAQLNLVLSRFRQAKHDDEAEKLLREADLQIRGLPEGAGGSLRHQWRVLAAELACRRDGDHRKAADLLDEGGKGGEVTRPAELAHGYLVCLEVLQKDSALPAAEKDKLRERYGAAAVARLKQSWNGLRKGKPYWAAWPELKAVEGREDYKALRGEIEKANGKGKG